MSDELRKLADDLDAELDTLGSDDAVSVAGPEPDYHEPEPDAGQAEDQVHKDDQLTTGIPDAGQAEVEGSGADLQDQQDNAVDEPQGNSTKKAGFVGNDKDNIHALRASNRKLSRHLSGAEKRAMELQQQLNEANAKLASAERAGFKPTNPQSTEELMRLARDGDIDAQAELNERFYQQQAPQLPANTVADDLPVYLNKNEQQSFSRLDAMNDANADLLASWMWDAVPRRGKPQADPQAARLYKVAAQIEAELLNDPDYLYADDASLLAEVVRRTQDAVRQPVSVQGGAVQHSKVNKGDNQGNLPGGIPGNAPVSPTQKRTPRSLSSGAGVSGVGRDDVGNSLKQRFEAAKDKIAFMRELTEDEIDQLYD